MLCRRPVNINSCLIDTRLLYFGFTKVLYPQLNSWLLLCGRPVDAFVHESVAYSKRCVGVKDSWGDDGNPQSVAIHQNSFPESAADLSVAELYSRS
jgi:hypothetical protein